MWHYQISSSNPASRFIEVTFKATVNADNTILKLPKWRPGRYELGNFAKNIRDFRITNESGSSVIYHKTDSHTWNVATSNCNEIIVSFSYYANQLDAGACFTDFDFLYVNPVHCMPYLDKMLHTECTLTIDVDVSWDIACGLKSLSKNVLVAPSYHDLVDSPFIASSLLKHDSFIVNDVKFHLWFQGEVNPDFEKIKKDFIGYTNQQFKMMGSFPVEEYHYLILITPYRFYHGVEHTTSTVLALGPGYSLMKPEFYKELLGVASHELFHTWNVKTLRPKDFVQYDYSQENYSRLGWVYEGFTTYYGDLFLARSGFFTVQDWFAEVNVRLQKHFDNDARFRYSVADSSFDTWLDGYVPGVPHRKTNIYDEGSIVAMMLDLYIRRASKHVNSLDTLFKKLYADFSGHHRGYQMEDILNLAIEMSDAGVKNIFDDYIHGIKNTEPLLNELLHEVGCYVTRTPAKNAQERCFGFKTMQEAGITKVATIYPISLAELAGLSKDDEIVAVNGWKVENNLNDLLQLNNSFELTVFSQKKMKTINLTSSDIRYFDTIKIGSVIDANEAQKAAFKSWINLQ
ncbi:MAG: M61 family metallopeptidase [Bacteroidota bacterium]